MDLKRQEIEDAPAYDPHEPIHRALETRIYDFYGRPKYWV